MRSRAETGNILRASGVPVIELQASIVIGSGSASFEMIRALVERLPVMITPRWVNTAAQPIAIEDVIDYLAASARLPGEGNRTFEIGGADVTSYMGHHARVRAAAEIAALDRARAVPQFVVVEPLVDADHAGLCGHWAISYRKRPESECGAEPGGPGRRSTFGPWESRARSSGPCERGSQQLAETRWSDARAASCRRVRIRSPLTIFSSMNRPPAYRWPSSGLRPDSTYWRTHRLVLRQCAVENSRPDRSDDGRRRHEARPARSRDSLPRKHFGFLACGILRARPAASIVRRDEGSRACLAGVPRGARWCFDRDPANRAVRAARAGSGFCTGIF